MNGFQRDSRLDRQSAIHGVKPQHPVHPSKAQHQLALCRHRPAGQASAAARRHDRHLVLVGPAHDALRFLHRGRQRDRQRRRRPAPGPVAAVMLQITRVGEQAQFGQAAAEIGEGLIGHDDSGGEAPSVPVHRAGVQCCIATKSGIVFGHPNTGRP